MFVAVGLPQTWETLYQPLGNTPNLEFSVQGLKAATVYGFRVRGVNSFGAGAWSYQVIQTPAM